MANTINNIKDGPGLFAKGVAETLRDNMPFCSFVAGLDEDYSTPVNGFGKGDTINVSIPPRTTGQEDDFDISSSINAVVEEKKPVVLNKSDTTSFELDTLELATEIDVKRALTRFGIPFAEGMAQRIEGRCMQIAANATYNSVGTPGSNGFTVADILAARTKLNQNLCRPGNRGLFMNSASGAAAVDARKGLFQDSTKIADQYREGMIGRADGFDWYETELIPVHANGSDIVGAAINDAAVAEGSTSLTVDGLSAAPTEGTVFTIDGVNMVHPITKTDLGVPQQFVVGAGATTTNIPISPAIYAASDGLQNVTALPADDAAITFVGPASTTLVQNLALHKDAFRFVSVRLAQPNGVDLVATQTVGGITVNIVRDFDINLRRFITRMDVLYAFDPIRPEWSTRLTA